MPRYQLELATPADDADLRRVLAETPMDGRIAISFRREPSYFDAAVVEGDFHQVIAVRDGHDGKIVGMGCRSVRSRYVNGRLDRIGYLSGLRLLAEHRSRGLVARLQVSSPVARRRPSPAVSHDHRLRQRRGHRLAHFRSSGLAGISLRRRLSHAGDSAAAHSSHGCFPRGRRFAPPPPMTCRQS